MTISRSLTRFGCQRFSTTTPQQDGVGRFLALQRGRLPPIRPSQVSFFVHTLAYQPTQASFPHDKSRSTTLHVAPCALANQLEEIRPSRRSNEVGFRPSYTCWSRFLAHHQPPAAAKPPGKDMLHITLSVLSTSTPNSHAALRRFGSSIMVIAYDFLRKTRFVRDWQSSRDTPQDTGWCCRYRHLAPITPLRRPDSMVKASAIPR